ncbi:Fc.00g108490.m01.CDS01 [Cosmosporella sp. VM-42]
MDTGLSAEGFQDSSQVMEGYLPQLTEAIKASLGADRIQIYDFTVRILQQHRRKLIYRSSERDILTIPLLQLLATLMEIDSQPFQRTLVFLPLSEKLLGPLLTAATDETREDAERIIKKLNPCDFEALSKLRWQVVIAWKPLRGPVRDWPLAVCDIRTVDRNSDLQRCDIIDPDQVSEEYLLHHSPEQKWYYLKEQMPNEVWVMLQTDSDGSIGVPHSAFPHPESRDTDPLRESVDVRMLVFYED